MVTKKRTRRSGWDTHSQVAEILETRVVLSNVTISISSGIVNIQGSPLDDDVRLSLSEGQLHAHHRTRAENGLWSPYVERNLGSPDRLKSIQYQAGAGHDRFQGTEEVVKQVKVPMVLNGGAGRDMLVGAAGPDVIRGGSENDYLSGSGGNDRLYGDGGTDALLGGHGGDFLDAGSAKEKVFDGGADASKSEKDYDAWRPVLGGISIDDVHQNKGQNCAFLATLSSVARTKTVDLAKGLSYKGNDKYVVTFAGQLGKPIEVIFNGERNPDDPLPNPKVHPDGEFWTILYWRAFQKAYRGPAYIPDIILPNPLKNPRVAFEALTGRTPVEENRRIDLLWNDAKDQAAIATALAANHAIVAGTLDGSSVVSPFFKVHSYAVIGFKPAKSGKEAIVTLRNPWGHNGDGNRHLRGEFSVTWSQFRSSIGKYFISR